MLFKNESSFGDPEFGCKVNKIFYINRIFFEQMQYIQLPAISYDVENNDTP